MKVEAGAGAAPRTRKPGESAHAESTQGVFPRVFGYFNIIILLGGVGKGEGVQAGGRALIEERNSRQVLGYEFRSGRWPFLGSSM